MMGTPLSGIKFLLDSYLPRWHSRMFYHVCEHLSGWTSFKDTLSRSPTKHHEFGAGEITLQLRASIVLAEDPGSVSSTHAVVTPSVTPILRGYDILF